MQNTRLIDRYGYSHASAPTGHFALRKYKEPIRRQIDASDDSLGNHLSERVWRQLETTETTTTKVDLPPAEGAPVASCPLSAGS